MDRFTFDVTDDEAARGLREQAAAHGRSVEAELDALVRETYARAPAVAAPQAPDDDWVHELIRIANGAGEGVFDRDPAPSPMGYPPGMEPLPGESFVDHIIRISRPGFDIDLPERGVFEMKDPFDDAG